MDSIAQHAIRQLQVKSASVVTMPTRPPAARRFASINMELQPELRQHGHGQNAATGHDGPTRFHAIRPEYMRARLPPRFHAIAIFHTYVAPYTCCQQQRGRAMAVGRQHTSGRSRFADAREEARRCRWAFAARHRAAAPARCRCRMARRFPGGALCRPRRQSPRAPEARRHSLVMSPRSSGYEIIDDAGHFASEMAAPPPSPRPRR